MAERHMREIQALQLATENTKPKHKWSSGLLNTRRVEEHLMCQLEFVKAAEVKAIGDESEAEEVKCNESDYWLKGSREVEKLWQRQAREVLALRTRMTSLHDELA